MWLLTASNAMVFQSLISIKLTTGWCVTSKKIVTVDMSGNGELISQLHAKLQDNMLFSSYVGLTHWSETDKGPDFNADRSEMFFLPGHIRPRYQDWGPEKFEKKASAFMQRAAIDSGRWLEITTVKGLSGLSEQFEAVSQGQYTG